MWRNLTSKSPPKWINSIYIILTIALERRWNDNLWWSFDLVLTIKSKFKKLYFNIPDFTTLSQTAAQITTLIMPSKVSQCLGPSQTKVHNNLGFPTNFLVQYLIFTWQKCMEWNILYVIPLQEKQICSLIMFTVNYSTPPHTDNILEHVRAEKRGSEKVDSYDQTPRKGEAEVGWDKPTVPQWRFTFLRLLMEMEVCKPACPHSHLIWQYCTYSLS